MVFFIKVIPYDNTSHYPPWHKIPLKAHFQVTETHQRLWFHIIITNKLDFVQFVACRVEAHQGWGCVSARRCDCERWVRLWITKPLIWGDTSLIGTNGGGWPLPNVSTDLTFTKALTGLRFLPTSAFDCVLPWEPGEKVNGFSAAEQCGRALMVVTPGFGGHVEGELDHVVRQKRRNPMLQGDFAALVRPTVFITIMPSGW